jgi:hypothetical protein
MPSVSRPESLLGAVSDRGPDQPPAWLEQNQWACRHTTNSRHTHAQLLVQLTVTCQAPSAASSGIHVPGALSANSSCRSCNACGAGCVVAVAKPHTWQLLLQATVTSVQHLTSPSSILHMLTWFPHHAYTNLGEATD